MIIHNSLLRITGLYLIETVGSAQIASYLNERVTHGRMKILIQVNMRGKQQQNGCLPKEVLCLGDYIRQMCPRLELCGLMALVGEGEKEDFAYMRELYQQLPPENQRILSLGMSGDYEKAIAAGSNQVRLGSCIFNRQKCNNND